MKPNRIGFPFLLSLLILGVSFSATAADVHSLGYSSVDANEIRWDGSNLYSSARTSAITQWNSLNQIDIVPDDLLHVEDVHLSDVYRSDVAWVGLYTNMIGTDSIQVNNYYLDNDTAAQRTNVFLHELGHALGIGDHDSPAYSSIVMYYMQTSTTAPQDHDITDYNNLWGP